MTSLHARNMYIADRTAGGAREEVAMGRKKEE
jgi:hypothetical protein